MRYKRRQLQRGGCESREILRAPGGAGIPACHISGPITNSAPPMFPIAKRERLPYKTFATTAHELRRLARGSGAALVPAPMSTDALQNHLRAGRRVEYASIAWTSAESLIGITVGLLTGSIALLGFGFDSVIEVASSSVLLWRLSTTAGADREKIAHRLIGFGFLALGLFVAFDASRNLITRSIPSVSYFGIAYAAACVVVMPLLARAKRRVAGNLGSDALHADSHQSDICAYLSLILLVGLGVNALLGWWWADAVAALCMVPIIFREAIAGLRGEACCHEHRF